MKRLFSLSLIYVICLLSFGSAYAQQSTEKGTTEPQAKKSGPEMMFVQNARSGSLTELKEEKGAFILKLEGVSNETIAFSDRPDRIVTQVATEKLIKSSLFKSKDAPNAAIEILGADENADVMVVTLQNPTYDAKTGTLQYLVRPLKDPKHSRAVYNKRHDQSLPASFGPTALFIDNMQHASCSSGTYACCDNMSVGRTCEYNALTNIPCCWKWSEMECDLCNNSLDLDAMCKAKYPQYPKMWDRGQGCHGW
ncbi:MAG: hypothetical protein NT178_03850 [Proteobacteria bacterium]|nr:hypothetical protein [Pseudomonadota bacterium]